MQRAWSAREETRRAGALLIFDEVVTGFRVAPGGAQEKFAVTPDMTTLAKILSGGLPGGACVGRGDVMSYIATKPSAPRTLTGKTPKVSYDDRSFLIARSISAGSATPDSTRRIASLLNGTRK